MSFRTFLNEFVAFAFIPGVLQIIWSLSYTRGVRLALIFVYCI